MNNFQFRMPTKVMFGEGISKNLARICKDMNSQKLFIITGPNIVKTDMIKSFRESLEIGELDYEIYSDITADPPIEIVDKAADALKQSEADMVAAIGGGSPMDTAKAICMLQTNKGSIKEYLFGGSKTVLNHGIPLICLPTTAGSGSELTGAAVITDEKNKIKLSVTHDYLMPKMAVIDPRLHIGMPPFVTATTGMDALTHAIEAYVSLNAEPVSDALALQAIKMIGTYLRKAVANGNDVEARSNMAVASMMAGAAFLNAGLGVVHGIAQAMGGIAHVPHGVANSLILPYAMERNYVGNFEKFKEIAVALGENIEGLTIREAAKKSVDGVSKLNKDIGIPDKLDQVGISRQHFPAIIEGTMAYRLLSVNPCKLNAQDIETILQKAL